MDNTHLFRAALNDGDLSTADLTEVPLGSEQPPRAADLRGANLTKAKLQRAGLRHEAVRHSNIQRVDMNGADVRGTAFSGSNLRHPDPVTKNQQDTRAAERLS
jgi:uncharacterized protein YjbI with pentapeptide repeats